jgi:CubicO group peptidase (beta-lactamase class C family)
MNETRPGLPAFSAVDAAMRLAVARGELPGGVVRVEVGRPGRVAVHESAAGLMAIEPQALPLNPTTVYDTASLTKVVVTAPVLMRLVEGGALDLRQPVREIVPGFEGGEGMTVRHLLTHTSGLPAGLPLQPCWSGHEAAVELACRSLPTHPPDGVFRYSDVNFILLGDIAQRLTGCALDVLAQQWIFAPLGMRDSGFRPLRRLPPQRVAPTEWVDEAAPDDAPGAVSNGAAGAHAAVDASAPRPRHLLRGTVHDPTARRMGGVAGHAGLFSTAADIARYARMVLEGGTLDGAAVLRESTVAQMTAVATPPTMAERRSLGWDIDTPLSRARGRHPRPGSFGHTGFTGCALWIDPPRHTFHVLLSNRVHPVARQSIVALYEEIGTLAAEAAAQAGSLAGPLT